MAIAWICINCNAELMEDDDEPVGGCQVCEEQELKGAERTAGWYWKFEKKERLRQVGGLDYLKEFDRWT
jgi:hypothetical protein|tara:strand:- start:5514 stop:5720 length:207 start_codon:yes stop_codon:yes gene_type:complete